MIAVGPQGSRNTMLTAVQSAKHGLRWWVGCKHAISTEQLRALVKETHGVSEHGDDYRAVIDFVENHPARHRHIVKHKAADQAEGA
jgi:hypothetical protein